MLGRVLFAGGGTGGHLYPGLAVADQLAARGVNCRFIGTARGLEARVVPERGYPLDLVTARGLAGGLAQKLGALAATLWASWQCWNLLRRHKPQLVVTTGGYVCAPVLLASALRQIPVVMLEQNALPGKVNRTLARLARRICLSFEESKRFFPAQVCRVTGNPIRQEILAADRQQARQALGLESQRPVLLVTGASQGAASLNEAVVQALSRWRDRPWTVLHLTGPTHLEATQRSSQASLAGPGQVQLDYRPLGYLADMHLAYAAADLVVARAGATTLAELTARGLPSILVPYPFAAERHQDYNADALVQRGAALKLADSAVRELLADVVADLLEDSGRLGAMAEASLAGGRPGALDDIVQLLEQEFGPLPALDQQGTRKDMQ